MKHWLQRNPFPVEAWFESSITLTFAVPKDELAARLPAHLMPDTFADAWAFMAVAMVKTRGLRPRGLPRLLGRDFLLVGYRNFVRYRSESGRVLRGLHIVRSETDQRGMVTLGNVFTPYHYVHTGIRRLPHGGGFEDPGSGFSVLVDADASENHALPMGSPFATWTEARRYCGPMPYTFSPRGDRMVVIEGVRSDWKPRPVSVIQHRIPYLDQLGFTDCRLACAFIVENIPYRWKRGRIETPASS